MSDTIKIDAAELAREAAWINKGKGAARYVPILQTAQVSTSSEGLRIRRSDYSVWREATVPADGSRDGAVVQVNLAQLAALTKGGKGDAFVTVADTGVTVTNGARTVTLPSAGEVDDFPQWPVFTPGDEPAVMDAATLKRGLTSVGRDDTLPMLTGVRFEDGEMVTTDRFRMSRITYAESGFTALVPREVLDLFTAGKDQVTVEHGNTGVLVHNSTEWVRVSAGNRSAIAPVVDAEFPKYRQLIAGADEGATVFAQFRRTDLLAAFDTRAHQVRLHLRGDGTMQVSTGPATGGDGVARVEQTIAASVSSHDEYLLPFLIAANPAYLASILKGIASDIVEFTASKPARPMVFKAGADYHLLMPVRLPG